MESANESFMKIGEGIGMYEIFGKIGQGTYG